MEQVKRRAMLARGVAVGGALHILAGTPARAAANEPVGVILPPPDRTGMQPLEQALVRRRSVRTYSSQPLPLAAVSQLLWAAQGTTTSDERRTAPSAGALYPLQLHLVAARVLELAPGVYRYVPRVHSLQLTIGGVVMPALSRAALGQQAVAHAAALVVIAAEEDRTAQKYGARAGRYVAFEAGAACQNLALQAAALRLATVVIGAFDDGAVADALQLAPGERPLALMPIGMPG